MWHGEASDITVVLQKYFILLFIKFYLLLSMAKEMLTKCIPTTRKCNVAGMRRVPVNRDISVCN